MILSKVGLSTMTALLDLSFTFPFDLTNREKKGEIIVKGPRSERRTYHFFFFPAALPCPDDLVSFLLEAAGAAAFFGGLNGESRNKIVSEQF